MRARIRAHLFSLWLAFGRRSGWASGAVCTTHDGLPQTPAEEVAWEDGDDPCIHAVRLFDSRVAQQEAAA